MINRLPHPAACALINCLPMMVFLEKGTQSAMCVSTFHTVGGNLHAPRPLYVPYLPCICPVFTLSVVPRTVTSGKGGEVVFNSPCAKACPTISVVVLCHSSVVSMTHKQDHHSYCRLLSSRPNRRKRKSKLGWKELQRS